MDLIHADLTKRWPENSDFFMFQEYDPDNGNVYIYDFCNEMVRRNVVIGPSNDDGHLVGVCKTYGRVCTAYKNHVCQRWKWAGGMYGNGVTIAMTWNGHYCKKGHNPYKVDFDTCKDRLEQRVLKPCRVDMWNKHPNKDFLNIGGMFAGTDECVEWTMVSTGNPPPEVWADIEPPK
jgi:hypothetical protein